MTIEEMLRAGAVRTANNGLMWAVVAPQEDVPGADERTLERMVEAVPRALTPRLGKAVCYFVPWLYKQRRSVLVGTAPAAEGETRKELCHHLDVKPAGNLLLISLNFYEHDSYGLASDINPVQNPSVRGELVIPLNGTRNGLAPGTIVSGGVVVRAMRSVGMTWGGTWSSLKDFMHFSLNGH